MNYTEQQKRKQEILQRIRAQQQMEQQRAKQKEFGLDDIQNLNNYRTGINTASKNTAKLGKALSNSGNKVVSGIGNKLQTVGKMGQNLTGEAAKQSISNAIKSKLGLGATKAAATGATTGATTGAAAGTAGTTAATTAGTLGAGTTAATTGATTAGALGAGTTAAGTAGALGTGATAAGTAAGTAATTGATTAALGAGATGATAAGTGAAAAGAGAAGAAGAGAGAAALGALGPVGAALAAGYMIYNMVQSAKKKKAAKQMQVSAQAAEEGAQQAAAKKASAMQNLQTQIPQIQTSVPVPEIEQPQVEQVAEQPQEDSSAMDIMQMIPGLSEENADVPNAEAMPTSLPEAPEVEAPQLEAPQIEPTALEGTPTGFATDVSPETTKASLMERIKAGVGNIGNTAQGGLDKLSSGVNDFVAGYKDNAQTSLTEGDLYKRLMPTQDEQTGEMQTEDGAYVLSADEKKKNLMNRIGEAVGTGRRIVAHPLTQGTIAGLAYAKSEDDPLYGLGKGVEWAQNKAKSDYYQRKIDPNSTPSIMGGYSEKDYNADTLSKYRDTMAEKNRQAAILAQRKQEFDENMKNKQFAEEQKVNNAKIKHWENDDNIDDAKWENEQADRNKKLKAEIYAGLQDGTYVEMVDTDGSIKAVPAYEVKEAEALGLVRKKKGWFQ